MAGAEKLIDKILGDAQAEAEKLLKDAENKKQAMLTELNSDLEKQKARMEKDAEAAIQENRRRLAAVNDLEYRKQLLAAKQEMMEKTKGMALQKLLALSDPEYLSLMKRRLTSCASSGEGVVIVSAGDKRLDDAFLRDVNGELKKTAGKGELSFAAERTDIKGGFIYKNGGMEINMSLEAMLTEAWQDAETEVAAILFQ